MAALTTVGTFITLDSLVASLAVKSMFILVYPLLVWLFRGLSTEEIKSLSLWVVDQIKTIRGEQNEVA